MSSSSIAVLVKPLQEGFSPEFDLVCACAGTTLSAGQVALISERIDSGLRWDEVIRLAEHHNVLPLVARNLATHAHGVPAKIEEKLRIAYEENARRNLWFAAELARIAQGFARQNVRAIPFKGPVLAESVYGDLALRSFNDLDFLVAAGDFAAAKDALAGLGYAPSTQLDTAAERMALRTGYELAFSGAAGPNLVELQWRVLPHFCAVDLQTGDLLERSVRVKAPGCEMHALSSEDMLLVLCLHAAKHLWMRLLWVADVAEALRTVPIDWDTLQSRARVLRVERMVAISFWLARDLLGAALPDAAQALVARDPAVAVPGRQYALRLAECATYDFESPDYFRLFMSLRERRRDRYRYLWRLVWTPGSGDIAAIHLPQALHPLYRVVRVGRLLRKLVVSNGG